jgi:hypothetical protein
MPPPNAALVSPTGASPLGKRASSSNPNRPSSPSHGLSDLPHIPVALPAPQSPLASVLQLPLGPVLPKQTQQSSEACTSHVPRPKIAPVMDKAAASDYSRQQLVQIGLSAGLPASKWLLEMNETALQSARYQNQAKEAAERATLLAERDATMRARERADIAAQMLSLQLETDRRAVIDSHYAGVHQRHHRGEPAAAPKEESRRFLVEGGTGPCLQLPHLSSEPLAVAGEMPQAWLSVEERAMQVLVQAQNGLDHLTRAETKFMHKNAPNFGIPQVATNEEAMSLELTRWRRAEEQRHHDNAQELLRTVQVTQRMGCTACDCLK